ncbi:hypothetical protein GLOIN_2v1731446 [Rhizophagus irregularis DAOM 181602=DAOM 197198]|nr:hypothetical protein GLOIN_2v1731446 [Rhizophagus irregularis DAOM 181602=DAOM 197198]
MLKVKIENKENGSKFHKDAHLDTKLSDFRKELEETDEINDKLSFSQKFDDDFAVEISRVNEDDFMLKDFMEEFTEGSNEIDMFLVTTTYWKFLNKLNQLDRGWMITSEGIERANKQALILHSAKIVEVNAVNAEKQVTVSYKYEKDMKRFYITDKNVPNFAGRSKKNGKSASPSKYTVKYTVYEKARFEIDKLKASVAFIEEVKNAIEDGKIEKFEKITEKYGQFIPTKIILGGLIENDEKQLKYCRYWDCIEFQEQKSVFHFVDAGLRKKIYSIFGKKILYSLITIEKDDSVNDENIDDNYKVNKIKLPSEVSNIISNNADCSIFATAVGMNYCYHCQILTSPGKEPELMVHCLEERSDDTEILIRWIVIGYDTYLKPNIKFESMKLKVLRKDYMPYDECNHKMFELLDSSDYYCVGIPVVDKKDSLIGHCFSNDYKELNTFAYSLREKRCERLPKFSFNVLAIPKKDTTLTEQIKLFEKDMNDSIITVGNEQILLKQRLAQIKVKFLGENSQRDFKCLFLIPFESDDDLTTETLDTLKNYYVNSHGKLNEVLSNVSSGVLSNVTSGGVKLIKKLTPRRNSKETNGKLETK